MITIDNVQYRNLEEQVKKNMDDIKYILEEEGVLNEFGIKVVGHITSPSQLPDPDTYEGEYGDAYAVGRSTPYTLYIYTRANGSNPYDYWFNIGQFPAPSTVPGPVGPQGPQGDPGTRGSTWTNGTSNPTNTSGYIANDKYLNTTDGSVFNYTGTAWQLVGNIRGPRGIQGPPGTVGPAGPQGIQGPQGPKGDPGPAFVIAGTLANEGQLPDPSTLADNIAYLVGTAAPYDLYVQLQDSSEWFNAGIVEGVQGPTGPTGPQGPRGPQGIQGKQGPTGPTGPAGITTVLHEARLTDQTSSLEWTPNTNWSRITASIVATGTPDIVSITVAFGNKSMTLSYSEQQDSIISGFIIIDRVLQPSGGQFTFPARFKIMAGMSGGAAWGVYPNIISKEQLMELQAPSTGAISITITLSGTTSADVQVCAMEEISNV